MQSGKWGWEQPKTPLTRKIVGRAWVESQWIRQVQGRNKSLVHLNTAVRTRLVQRLLQDLQSAVPGSRCDPETTDFVSEIANLAKTVWPGCAVS
jgi:hypothetical protein